MKHLLFTLVIALNVSVCALAQPASANPKVTVSGYIKDAASSESLIGVTISTPFHYLGAYRC
jgi:hypothetical protein